MIKKHAHGEAFMLMVYQCMGVAAGGVTGPDGVRRFPPAKGCGHRETFWNSRDGVTPFMMGCPSCGGDLQHVNWNADRYSPEHRPHYGQGVWRDGTPDEAEAILRKRIEKMKGTPYEVTDEYLEKIVAIVRDPDDPNNTEFRRGWPMFHRNEELP